MKTHLAKHLDLETADLAHRIKLLAGLLVIVLLAVVAGYFFSAPVLQGKHAGGLAVSAQKVNVLLLVVDDRPGDKDRGDMTFLLTVDTGEHTVALLAIPQDTRLKIPGWGWGKINQALALGDQQLAQLTMEQFLGMPLDYYLITSSSKLAIMADAVDGVDLDVEKGVAFHDHYEDVWLKLAAGRQHLDGEMLLAYFRYRDDSGDMGQINRQNQGLLALVQEINDPVKAAKLVATVVIKGGPTTNMTASEELALARLLFHPKGHGLEIDMVPGQPGKLTANNFWLPDLVATRRHVAQLEGSVLAGNDLMEAQQAAAEYELSLPGEVKQVEVKQVIVTKEVKADISPAVKVPDKIEVGKPVKQVTEGKITVLVINASGTPGMGGKIAAVMRSRGFEVTSIDESINLENNTVVISYTTNSNVVAKLTGLPFKYVLQVTKDDSKEGQVGVIVGKDMN